MQRRGNVALSVVATTAAVVGMLTLLLDPLPERASAQPVECASERASTAPRWTAADLARPAPGPGGLALTPAEIATAERVFAASPFVRRIYAYAGLAPRINRVTRVYVNSMEPRTSPKRAHMAVVIADSSRPICIPGGHNRVSFDTDNVHTSDPRGYETWIDPGAYRAAAQVVVYVDLWMHAVASVEGTSHDVETFPPGFEAPEGVKIRAHDLSD